MWTLETGTVKLRLRGRRGSRAMYDEYVQTLHQYRATLRRQPVTLQTTLAGDRVDQRGFVHSHGV